MSQVQLIAVQPGVATVQKDDEAPVQMSWSLLHTAQEQGGLAGYVYRWLMREFCRCEYEQRQGRAWQSPRREVAEIVADLHAQDIREAAEAEAAEAEAAEVEAAEAAQEQRAAAPEYNDYWQAVTDVPCPCCQTGTVRWAEAGHVPGYRICDGCGKHFVAAGSAEAPTLVKL